jgi:hypothetical protein
MMRRSEMEMFDELISTTIKPEGTVEERRVTEDALQSEAMDDACRAFVAAERRFRKINAHPDVVTDPRLNVEWWDLLELVYRSEKTVWRLFVGPQPDMRSNKLYARFRDEFLLKGKSLKADT